MISQLNRFCRNVGLEHQVRGCPEKGVFRCPDAKHKFFSVWELVAPYYSKEVFFHNKLTNQVSRDQPKHTASSDSFNLSLTPATPGADSELSPFWKCCTSPVIDT